MSRFSRLLVLVFGWLSVAAGPPTPCVALSTAPTDASARFRAVHVDTLDPKLQALFEDARRDWLKVLSLHHTTDGRGYFFQRAGNTFLTLRSFNSFAEYDALRAFRAAVGERIGPDGERAGKQYDGGDVALVPPHNSEVWSRVDGLDYPGQQPTLNEYTAGFLQMVTEQVTSDDYQAAWKEIHAALAAVHYPIGRVTFFSTLGSGRHISLWLAPNRSAFIGAGSPEHAVAESRGAATAATLFARLRASSSDVQVAEVVPRTDFASPP